MNNDSIRRINTNSNQYCRAWTESSIECFRRNCRCEGCLIKDIMETRCDMKRAVIELIRRYGIPPEKEKILSKPEEKIIQAILDGARNRKEIAEYAGETEEWAQSHLPGLYKLAEYDGVNYTNKRYKLPQFIKWVRDGGEIC